MRELSLIVLLLVSLFNQSSDSPHGEQLALNCDACHTSEGWKVDRKNISFNHDQTQFVLTGSHQEVNCVSCHPSLVFNEASTECMSCHADMHEQTVGLDCARCHTPASWIVPQITEIHQQSRFPLVGPHATADCYDCHQSASLLRFDPLGIECIDCHLSDYEATTSPNHIEGGFSTDCMDCHQMHSFSWSGASFTHGFFPLTGGHALNDCAACHKDGNDYSQLSPDCFSCHESDYNATTSPNHVQSSFPTSCTDCHTTNPGWRPAEFGQHDIVFPIYSGKHNNEWNDCADCHNSPGNYGIFTCIDCHEHNQSDMNGEHDEVSGYVYSSEACFECHPTGSGEGSFNHAASNFPLTGAHIDSECIQCHTNGYSGTSNICFDCHTPDFNQTTNPNHQEINISNECENCHSTDPGWIPATFDTHNEYYVLSGAHAEISNECVDCHNGNYVSTFNTCIGCHVADYNQTTEPPHAAAQFDTECLTCHNEVAWTPSTFDHDGQYFPIYSGKHNGEWTSCSDCHTTPTNITLFSCIDCHDHNKADTDEEHQGISGYLYNSQACFECHPTGSGEGSFNHSTSGFPLTGAHTNADCISCHESGYSGTSTICVDCHTTDYNQSTNPNHQAIGLPTDCMDCHSTEPGWEPASFSVHNNYYVLSGAHAIIANECVSCHNGNYNTTPNTCVSCHLDDYNQTTNPPHASAQFSTECASCHTQNAWEPSTFDHDGQYFPIYSGKHNGEWNTCADCHTTPGNYSIFSCIDCHEHNKPDMDDEHSGVSGYVYNSIACLDCHPNGSGKSPDNIFQHNIR